MKHRILTIISLCISIAISAFILIGRSSRGKTLIFDEQSFAFLTHFELTTGISSVTSLAFCLPCLIVSALLFCSIIVGLLFTFRTDLFYPLALFSLTPTAINAILNPSLVTVTIFLTLIIIICLEYRLSILSYILALLVGFTSLELGILSALLILSASTAKNNSKSVEKEYHKAFFVILFTTVVISVLFNALSLPIEINIFQTLVNNIFEFGNPQGISLVIVLIAVLGLLTAWIQNGKFEIAVSLLLIASLLLQNMLFLVFAACLIGGKVLEFLYSAAWESKFFKQASFFLIILMLISIPVLAAHDFINGPPNTSHTSLSKDIKTIDIQESYLYRVEYSHTLSFLTGANIIPKNHENDEVQLANLAYYSADLERTKEILDELEVSYIIITESMKEDIWNGEQKGLLIMITNTDTFSVVKQTNDYTIYEVKKATRLSEQRSDPQGVN
jgi:hypothetical protein